MSLEQLETQLRDYFAEQPTTGENLRIDNLTRLNAGWASDVYAFTLRYDEAGRTIGQNLVLKAYSDTIDGKDRALKERHALFNLRADHYPVPGVSAVEVDPQYIGRPFVVMEQVDGHLLWDAFQQADAQSDEARRTELLQLFVQLLIDLHRVPAEKLVRNMKVTHEYTLITREIYILRGLVQQYERHEFTPLIEWLHERRKEAPCTHPVVTHRDYHPWNVLLTENGRPFVIDWGWQVSDARYDVAWMLTLMERSGYPQFRDEALAAYEAAVGGPVEQLAYFEVLAHTRWLMEVTNSILYGVNLRDGSLAEFRALVADQVRYAVDVIEARTGVMLPVAQWL